MDKNNNSLQFDSLRATKNNKLRNIEKENIALRTENRKLKASLKKNGKKLSKSLATRLIALTAALSGVSGYGLSQLHIQNKENMLSKINYHKLYEQTNYLIKDEANEQLVKIHPEMKNYYLESFNEVETSGTETSLALNYRSHVPGRSSAHYYITLEDNFAQNVYRPYAQLREDSKKTNNKLSSWLKVNDDINKLTKGLIKYKEKSKDKSDKKSIDNILKKSEKTNVLEDDGFSR